MRHLILISLALFFILTCSVAQAAPFNIADGDTAGLINALTTANTNDEADTINLAAGGIYTLTNINNGQSGSANGLPVIKDDLTGPDLTIMGNGATIQRSGGAPAFRLLFIDTNASVTISNLTISNGSVRGSDGHTWPDYGGNGEDATGGGIYNAGMLTLLNCTLNGNSVTGGNGGNSFSGGYDEGRGGDAGSGLGGAIFLSFSSPTATLTATNCTFSNNYAQGGSGGSGGDGYGGGIFRPAVGGSGGSGVGGAIDNWAVSTLTNCTFSRNSTYGGADGDGETLGYTIHSWGGGISNGGNMTLANCTLSGNSANNFGFNINDSYGGGILNLGTMTLTNCTLSGNYSRSESEFGAGAGGGIYIYNGSVHLRNSIVAGNDASMSPSLYGPLATDDHNITNGAAEQAGLEVDGNGDPLLKDNGGPTQTIALMAGSPAIDSSNNAVAPPTDQRGVARPQPAGGTVDIGAFEFVGHLTINDVTVSEGNSGTTNANFTVALSPPSTQTITVQYATGAASNNSATPNADYVAVPLTTLTFAPGETSKQITVQVNGDLLNETYERFAVNLSNATGATVADAQGISIILDDDPVPTLKINDVTLTEGNSGITAATFTVSLSTPSGRNVKVSYATATPGSNAATSGVDYIAATATLTFTSGQIGKQITVFVNGDIVDEINERFAVNLSNASNATIADSEGFGTIVDDDAAPSLKINDVIVTEGPTQGNPAVLTSAIFTVTLSAPSSKTVTVQYATGTPSSNPAKADADYIALAPTTLTFAPGETSKTLIVQVKGDTLNEDAEHFIINLSQAGNATIADREGFGTILDAPSLSINDVTLSEGPAQGAPAGSTLATFTVTLSEPSIWTVQVNYATSDASSYIATPGVDYLPVSGTLSFAPGETSKPVQVVVSGDTQHETVERFMLKLSNPVNASLADKEGFCTITDDDAATLRFDSNEPSS